jgi:DnaJ like chaperone protein
MGLLGALVGGGLGFMLGGPIGAMLGGAIGASVNDPSAQSWRPSQGQPRLYGRCPNCRAAISLDPGATLICPQCGVQLRLGAGAGRFGGGTRGAAEAQARSSAQSAFMIALISLAAKVAKADGRVSNEEIAAFDAFLRDDLGMPAEDRRIAAQIFNRARDSEIPAHELAGQLRSVMAGQPDRLRDLVSLLLKIAWADGRLDPGEESLIRSVASDLGLSSRDYEEAKALFSRGNLAAAYALLGVAPTASDDDVRKSYRRLARDYHPDKVAAKGLPEDFLKFANEKLQAINEAYAQIRKARGF